MVPVPTRVLNPNGILIGSAVFAGLISVTDRQTTLFSVGHNRPHLSTVVWAMRPKTAEPIEMLFGMWTRVGPKKHALDGTAHWRHLAYTTEPSMCGGDTALRQITLTTYFFGVRWSLGRCG